MDLNDKGHYHKFAHNDTFDFKYIVPHLEEMKRQLRPDIKITFYGEGREVPFERKPLEECINQF
jgi:hypothetical protein